MRLPHLNIFVNAKEKGYIDYDAKFARVKSKDQFKIKTTFDDSL